MRKINEDEQFFCLIGIENYALTRIFLCVRSALLLLYSSSSLYKTYTFTNVYLIFFLQNINVMGEMLDVCG